MKAADMAETATATATARAPGGARVVKTPDGVEWALQERPCPVCASSEFDTIGKRGGQYHRDHLGATAQVVRCRNCSLYFAYPTLLPLSNPYEASGESYFVGTGHLPEVKIGYGQQLADKTARILGRKGLVIEAACGKGHFLVGARNVGWQVRGVEMTEYFANEARKLGIDTELASVEESAYLDEENKHDAIFMLAMLEHLYDPMAMMRKAYKTLVPGGLALINVPNEVTSLVHRLGNFYIRRAYGKDWTMSLSPTFAPFHVVGFSPRSLEHALKGCGFDIVELETVSGKNVLPTKSLKQKLESAGLSLALMFGRVLDRKDLGNEIWCWARKR
jgi:2-polyprenyl-3-methyl-5-hydroxy-6-metoxy-1,4-benzoquinol methylase